MPIHLNPYECACGTLVEWVVQPESGLKYSGLRVVETVTQERHACQLLAKEREAAKAGHIKALIRQTREPDLPAALAGLAADFRKLTWTVDAAVEDVKTAYLSTTPNPVYKPTQEPKPEQKPEEPIKPMRPGAI